MNGYIIGVIPFRNLASQIIDLCAIEFQVTWPELLSDRRSPRIVKCRAAIAVLTHNHLHYSWPEVATVLGTASRAHSSVLTRSKTSWFTIDEPIREKLHKRAAAIFDRHCANFVKRRPKRLSESKRRQVQIVVAAWERERKARSAA